MLSWDEPTGACLLVWLVLHAKVGAALPVFANGTGEPAAGNRARWFEIGSERETASGENREWRSTVARH